MRNVLEEARAVTLGGRTETFRSYAYLAERGEIFADTMRQIERELDLQSAEAAADWTRLAELADLLAELLSVQEQWLADHDAAIAAETESLRSDIRNLNLSSGKEKGEAQA